MDREQEIEEVAKNLQEALNIDQLIGMLEEYKEKYGNVPVVFESDYGDRAHTLAALPITEVDAAYPGDLYLKLTAYSKSGVAIEEEDRESSEWSKEIINDDPHRPIAIILR